MDFDSFRLKKAVGDDLRSVLGRKGSRDLYDRRTEIRVFDSAVTNLGKGARQKIFAGSQGS